MLSIVTFIFILGYGGYKLVLYFNRSEFTVNQTRQNYYYNLDDNFSHNDGFAIAAGVIGVNEQGLLNLTVEPEIG